MTSAQIEKSREVESARQLASLEVPARPHEQQRGFISFLTWPFVLAQVLTAENVVDGAIKPAIADEEKAASARTGQDAMANDDYAAASNPPRDKSSDTDALDDADAQSDLPDSSIDTSLNATRAPERVAEDGAHDKDAGGASHGASGAGGAASRSKSANAETGEVDNLDVSQELDDVPSGVTDVIETVQPVLGATTKTIVDLTDEVFGQAGSLIQDVGDTLGSAVGMVTNLLGGAIAVGGDILQSSASAIDAVFPNGGSQVTQIVAQASPIVPSANDAVETLVSGLSGDGGEAPLASGGIIAFSGLPSLNLPADDLYVDGHHTEYGLALHTAAPETSGLAAHDGNLEAPQAEGGTPTIDDDHEAGQVDQTMDSATLLPGSLTTTLDDAAIRGSDSIL
jgi:hypothetical protein